MATISVLKSTHTSLSTTVVDTVNLLQSWDAIEVSNQGASPIWLTYNGATPTASGDNTEIVEAGVTKLFPGYRVTGGIPGNASFPCHQFKLIGSGNPYSLIGVAGQ